MDRPLQLRTTTAGTSHLRSCSNRPRLCVTGSRSSTLPSLAATRPSPLPRSTAAFLSLPCRTYIRTHPTTLHHTQSDAHQHHKSTLRPWFDLHLKHRPELAARERPWPFCKSLHGHVALSRCSALYLSLCPVIPRPCTQLIRLPRCLDALGLSSIQAQHTVCHSMQARCSA